MRQVPRASPTHRRGAENARTRAAGDRVHGHVLIWEIKTQTLKAILASLAPCMFFVLGLLAAVGSSSDFGDDNSVSSVQVSYFKDASCSGTAWYHKSLGNGNCTVGTDAQGFPHSELFTCFGNGDAFFYQYWKWDDTCGAGVVTSISSGTTTKCTPIPDRFESYVVVTCVSTNPVLNQPKA